MFSTLIPYFLPSWSFSTLAPKTRQERHFSIQRGKEPETISDKRERLVDVLMCPFRWTRTSSFTR